MKLYLLPDKPKLPAKFSWIAYLESDRQRRVLFDTHYPFGSHYHIDQQERVIFSWDSLDKSLDLFFQKVKERFGPFAQEIKEILK
ncbi:hypothetical protein GvMRE_I2g110 [endosymbiont GvMRE of Glomus versiforme]|nr:hypothetical protein GvMRE_I2g110 [endosymbiont GvMRE of Glomus versiforme]